METLVLYISGGLVRATVADKYQETFVLEEIAVTAAKIADSLKSQIKDMKIAQAVCPGGVLKPLKKGCYVIDEKVIKDISKDAYGSHAYNRLTELAYELGKRCQIPAVMMYPMSCDELLPLNRITSHAEVRKYSRYHALEHRAGLRWLADRLESREEDINGIIAYIDDLTSVGAFERGACLDVNDCIGAEGPMGLMSSGDIPTAQAAEYFRESKMPLEEMRKVLMQESGLVQYTGISDMKELDQRYAADENVRTACEAMAYQTAKWIGSSALVLKGRADAILLAGRAMESETVSGLIKKRAERIAPVYILPELDAEQYMAREAERLGTYACPLYEY